MAITPATAADPHHLLIDQLFAQATGTNLLHSALVASGARSKSDFARYRFSIDRCLAEAQMRIERYGSAASTYHMLDGILGSIHDTILSGEFQGRGDNLCRTLDTGDFNCVTASAVFQIVSQRMGLNSRVELLPNHVRCRVTTGQKSFIVETTRRDGVQLAPPGNQGRLLTDKELLAKLYYNRALEMLKANAFQTALQHAELAWRLDPAHTEARENVAIVACRWAVSLAADHRWTLAVSLLNRAASTTGLDAMVANTEAFVFTSWIGWAQTVGSIATRQMVEDQLLLAISRRPASQSLLGLLQTITVE